MPSRNGNEPEPRDLSNWGISDTEVLAIVVDVAEPDGWSRTFDVRVQLGEHPEESKHRTGVPSRLAWLRRYGWLERNPEDGRWRLTPMGHLILDKPRLSASFERTLTGLTPAQQLAATRQLAERSAGAPPELHTAYRRQWVRSVRPR